VNIQNNRECHWVAGDFRIETAKPTRAQGDVDQSTFVKPFVPDPFNRLSSRMWMYGPKTTEERAHWINSRQRKELISISEAEKIIDAASVKAGRSLIATRPNFVQMTDAEFDRWYHSPARVEWVRVLISTSDRVRTQDHRNAVFSSASNTSSAQPLTARITTKLNNEGTRFVSQEGVSRSSHKAPVGSLSERIDALRMRVTEELRIANANYALFAELKSSWRN
jgi:hypothetical protein